LKTIVFAHANGFPAGTYEPIFERWRTAGWRVEAPARLGHDPAYPVTSNWPRLRDQLLDFIDARRLSRPMLVGHSLGGVVSLLAACRRPGLAGGVVMLDSPVVAGWRAHSVRVVKRMRLIERVGPGSISRRRRHEWPTRAAVHAHFAAKSAFARWDPRMLDAYVQAGFDEQPDAANTPSGGRVVLAFRREIETRIYNTLPHHVSALLRRHPPQCPVAFVAGTRSEEMRQAGHAASHALAGDRWRTIEGTHLYPMERPDETAALVLELLGTM
jgi:pimeloyl-ACP methyl ester carboxylesterase